MKLYSNSYPFHRGVFRLMAAALLISRLGAQETAGPAAEPRTFKAGDKVLLIEPRSVAGEVSVLLPGARKTYASAAVMKGIGFRSYTRDEFRREYAGGWKAFYQAGLEAAAEHLKTLKPTYKRDSKRVIEYAILESEHPLTATTVLLPEFADQFRETLGSQLYVVMPSRYTVLVFPKLATTIKDYTETLTDLYKDAIYPASAEIFEITEEGLRIFGAFSPD